MTPKNAGQSARRDAGPGVRLPHVPPASKSTGLAQVLRKCCPESRFPPSPMFTQFLPQSGGSNPNSTDPHGSWGGRSPAPPREAPEWTPQAFPLCPVGRAWLSHTPQHDIGVPTSARRRPLTVRVRWTPEPEARRDRGRSSVSWASRPGVHHVTYCSAQSPVWYPLRPGRHCRLTSPRPAGSRCRTGCGWSARPAAWHRGSRRPCRSPW